MGLWEYKIVGMWKCRNIRLEGLGCVGIEDCRNVEVWEYKIVGMWMCGNIDCRIWKCRGTRLGIKRLLGPNRENKKI